MKLLIFAGAGSSAELGVPTMRPMAEGFLQHLKDLDWPEGDYQEIALGLKDEGYDMEHLVDSVDSLRRGLDEQKRLKMAFDEQVLLRMRSVTREAEWYVQHACEQIVRTQAEALWAPILASTASLSLTVATTNYDRAIEIGARSAGVQFADGFEEHQHREVSEWCGFASLATRKILKLHGSTDWYLSHTGEPVKLKHPIPMFGDFTLSSMVEPDRILTAALVLPSREKRITQRPYPTLLTEFHNEADKADAAVFLGTSLRDPHLKDVFIACARKIPAAYVSRNAPPPAQAPKAVWIRQTASYFLMSTLPWAVAEPNEFESRLEVARKKVITSSVINPVIIARDRSLPSEERCRAIDALLSNEVRLPNTVVEQLIGEDDRLVRIFSLGLIPASDDPIRLASLATQKAQALPDIEFQRECELLNSLMKKAG